MVWRSFIPKFPYSESCYVPKIPYSERPSTIWILCYEDSLVRSSSSPKGAMFQTSIFRKSPLPHTHTGSILRRSYSPKFPSSKIAMFRRFYLPASPVVYGFCVTKVLPDDILIFRGKFFYNTGTVHLFCYNDETINKVFHWCSYDLDMSCYYNVY